MKWIDKTKEPFKSSGDAIVKEFLDNCCLNENGRYENVRYDSKRDFGHNPCFCNADGGRYRKRLSQILIDCQDGYCCYCMRKLKTNQPGEDSDELITREHIIPRGFTSADTPADKIAYYQQSPELSVDNVIMTDCFEDSVHDQTNDLPPYPHKVAYNNLVASCNGTFPYELNAKGGKSKIYCNEFRLEKDAYPVYFIKNIEDMLEYLKTGDIQAKHSAEAGIQNKITTVIASTQLDCDALKDIRHLWFLLSHLSKEQIYSCTTEAKRDHLLSVTLYRDSCYDNDRTVYLHDNFTRDEFWNTFMLYDYFYDVYSVMH